MTAHSLDLVAFGTCYVDHNASSFPFDRTDMSQQEYAGGTYQTEPGGSAVNFCRLSQRLGLKTGFIGMTGVDAMGDLLQTMLTQEGVEADLIRQPELQTSMGFNMTNPEGDHLMFVVGDAHKALSPDVVVPQLGEVLQHARLLYLGGCLKLTNFIEAFPAIAEIAQSHDTHIAVDHGRVAPGASPAMLQAVRQLVLKADYYFPSRDEFCTLWDVADIPTGLAMLHTQAPQLTTIVKDGANGAFYLEGDAIQHVPALPVEHVVNATGAGDSFNAGAMAALHRGLPLATAVAYGCQVAAAKVQAHALPSLVG